VLTSAQTDVLVLGRAIHKLAHSKESIGTITNLEEYIDPFHRIRIGIRLLLGQHIGTQCSAVIPF